MIRPATGAALVALVGVAVFLLFRPALSFELMGDDYQWLQHAHAASHRPALLLADLDTFYRPANTWTLAVDRLIWGIRPAGYHLTNLVLHSAAAVALLLAAARLGAGHVAAAAAALVWACSPFTDEPAISVAIRFENLLLLAWLALALLWPATGERWTRRRLLAVAAATLLAVMSKETWVVTAALVWALERGRDGGKPWKAAIPFAAAAAVYTGAYFLAFPTGKGYFSLDPGVLAKIPHQLAAFLYLEPFVPVEFAFSWRSALAVLIVAGAAAFAVRRKPQAGWFAVALLWAPSLPTLLVPYLPPRYTAIPYAGFVLLAVAVVGALADRVSPAGRRTLLAVASAAAGAVLVAGVVTVRADLEDVARVSNAHSRLLAQAREVSASFPLDRPVLVVRAEHENPLVDVARSAIGTPKLFYVRHLDPSGLIDAAALFEWVLDREAILVRRWDDGATRFAATPGAVLVHHARGFAWAAEGGANLATEAERWKSSNVQARFVAAETSH